MDDRQFDLLMEKLEMIRGCIIDVETAAQNIKVVPPSASPNSESAPCIHPIEFRRAYPGIVICLKCGERV